MKNARAKRAKLLFLIVKYANLGGFVAVAVVVFKLPITAELPHKTVPCYCPCPLLLTADQFLKFDFKIKIIPDKYDINYRQKKKRLVKNNSKYTKFFPRHVKKLFLCVPRIIFVCTSN